jgi:hypothetical protein
LSEMRPRVTARSMDQGATHVQPTLRTYEEDALEPAQARRPKREAARSLRSAMGIRAPPTRGITIASSGRRGLLERPWVFERISPYLRTSYGRRQIATACGNHYSVGSILSAKFPKNPLDACRSVTWRAHDNSRCRRQGKSARAFRLIGPLIRCWAARQWLQTAVRAQRICTGGHPVLN